MKHLVFMALYMSFTVNFPGGFTVSNTKTAPTGPVYYSDGKFGVNVPAVQRPEVLPPIPQQTVIVQPGQIQNIGTPIPQTPWVQTP